MTVTLKAGQYGWDYLLVYPDGRVYLVQSDRDYVPVARMFGFQGGDQDTQSAGEFLDDHLDETVEADIAPGSYYHIAEPSAEETELTSADVEFGVTCIDEDLDYRSEFSDDPQTVAFISRELARGNEWAWCTVCVSALWGSLEGTSYLGGCSYKSRRDFILNSGYYEDMKDNALEDLNRKLAARSGSRAAAPAVVRAAWVPEHPEAAQRLQNTPTTPLTVSFSTSGMTLKHDGSLGQGDIDRLRALPDEVALAEMVTPACTNGLLYWVDPEEIGSLTEMPLLARQDECERDENSVLIRCTAVFCWERYQVDSIVEAIFSNDGAFLKRRVINFYSSGGAPARIHSHAGSGAPARTEEVVKEDDFPLEGEWEKDER